MGMLNFLQIPGSIPWWLLLLAIIPVALYALMFLAIPFSVFGIKGRLDAMEARLDDMHADIRSVALLHAAHGARGSAQRNDSYDEAPPPIAPARVAAELDGRQVSAREAAGLRKMVPQAGGRAEPRLNWPK